jgi:hypothetical protein
MSVDPTKTQFASEYNVDKIAAYSTITDSSPSSVGIGLNYSIPGSGSFFPTYTLESIPNPYGKKCLTNLSWSIDGASFYDQDAQLPYYNSSSMEQLVQMGVQCGCSNSEIYFFFQSSYTSTQTVYLQFAIDNIL